jgi:flagellar hook-associated protein 3 FlgL
VALGTLSQAESVLGDVGTLLQDVHTSAVAAGNGSLADSDRQSIAQDVAGKLQQLMGYANSTDGTGSYLFGGYSDTTKPYSLSGASVVYAGDQGSRGLQVSDSRVIDVSVNGASVFDRIPTGNGVFSTSAAVANTGSGTIDAGQIASAAAMTSFLGHSYQVVIDPGGTSYTVNDTTTGGVVSINGTPQTGIPYTSGSQISFNGIQFSISGAPAPGDTFDVAPATIQSVFTTLQKLVTLLNKPVVNAADRAALAGGVAEALTNIDNASGKALAARAMMGSRMNEIDSLQTVSSSQDISLKTALSSVEDVDYAEAISLLSRQQMALEAAQKSFVSTTQLSVFKLL